MLQISKKRDYRLNAIFKSKNIYQREHISNNGSN